MFPPVAILTTGPFSWMIWWNAFKGDALMSFTWRKNFIGFKLVGIPKMTPEIVQQSWFIENSFVCENRRQLVVVPGGQFFHGAKSALCIFLRSNAAKSTKKPTVKGVSIKFMLSIWLLIHLLSCISFQGMQQIRQQKSCLTCAFFCLTLNSAEIWCTWNPSICTASNWRFI